MPYRSASSSMQPAWATPCTSALRRTNLQHRAPKTQVQTHLNQTSAPSKIKQSHERNEKVRRMMDPDEFPLYCWSVSLLECFCSVSLMALEFCFLGANTFSAEGKDGSPMGVMWRGGAHITCSVKHNRSKSHIISLHRPTSLYP